MTRCWRGAWVAVLVGVLGYSLPGARVAAAPAGEAGMTSPIYLNVRDFGAIGDGKADDTEAIASAIKAAGTQDPARANALQPTILFFPPGIFRVTRTLLFKDPEVKIKEIQGSGSIGNTEACQLRYDGPAGGTLLDFAPFAGTKIRELTLSGNDKAGTLLRITSAPGWASFGTNIERVTFTKADTGIEVGDGLDSCASDMTFTDVNFSKLKKNAFRAMNNQNVDYVFLRCAVGETPVAYYFSHGGNAHFIMPTFFRCNTAFKFETGGINAGVFSITGLQLENFGYDNPKKRMVVLEASGEQNIAFNSIFTGCISCFGPEADLDTPNFILHSSAQVTIRDSMISGRIAVLSGDDKAADPVNGLATWLQFDNCRFRCAANPQRDIQVTGNAGYELRNCHVMVDDTKGKDYVASMKPTFIAHYAKYPPKMKVISGP